MFKELLGVRGVRGVIRFHTAPAFSTPTFRTLVYTAEVVVVSAFVRGYGLWDWLPLEGGQEGEPGALDGLAA